MKNLSHGLEILETARNYNGALLELIKGMLGEEREVLDFGAGRGIFAQELSALGFKVDCVEPNVEFQKELQRKMLSFYDDLDSLNKRYHRIYSLNVIEHIQDDTNILSRLHDLLMPQGRLLVFVPARMFLFNKIDESLGHFRRYEKPEIEEKMTNAGFQIEDIRFFDPLGAIAWYVAGMMAKKIDISHQAIFFFDTFIFPLSRAMHCLLGQYFGKNLLVIAKRA